MKKIIFIAVFFSFSIWAGTSDTINLSSEIDPVCEVSFDAEPVASNLDLTSSQSNLKVATSYINNNTDHPGSPYMSMLSLDLSDHLTHQVVSSHSFIFSNLKLDASSNGIIDPFPFGSFGPEEYTPQSMDFYLSYTGIPALSLIQGVYSATWYMSCSIEPRI